MSTAPEDVAVESLIRWARNLGYPAVAEVIETVALREGDGVALGLAVSAIKFYVDDENRRLAWTEATGIEP